MPERAQRRTRTPVHQILRELKAGDRRKLSREDRIRCVDALWGEGISVAEMAELFGVEDRTISRDRAMIRQRIAEEIGTDLAPRLASDLIRQNEISISAIRRLARDTNATVPDRLACSVQAVALVARTIEACKTLGLLPAAFPDPPAVLSKEEFVLQTVQLAAVVSDGTSANPALAEEVRALLATLRIEQPRAAG